MPDDIAGFMLIVVYKFVLYGIIFLMVFYSKFTTIKNIVIYSTIAIIYFLTGGQLYTSLFGLFLMLFVSDLITLNEKNFLKAIKSIFIINILVTIAQIIGIADFFYYHMFYFPKDDFGGEGVGYTYLLDYNLFTEIDRTLFTTPQMRPSGIFPSTIYFTFFHMSVFSLLFYSKLFKSKWYIIYAFSSIISGSSALLLIAICSILLTGHNRQFILLFSSYLLFMLIGFSVQYPWFSWSYNIGNITDSFFSRNYDFAGEHLLHFLTMYTYSALIIFTIVSMVLSIFLRGSLRYVYLVVMLLLPIIIHNLYHFIGFMFLISILFTYVSKSKEKRKLYTLPTLL